MSHTRLGPGARDARADGDFQDERLKVPKIAPLLSCVKHPSRGWPDGLSFAEAVELLAGLAAPRLRLVVNNQEDTR